MAVYTEKGRREGELEVEELLIQGLIECRVPITGRAEPTSTAPKEWTYGGREMDMWWTWSGWNEIGSMGHRQ